MATDVQRLRYYERQFLGATDFDDEQTYHRDSLRRHLLGPHTWGIVTGLELTTTSATGGGLEVTIEPGLAIDAFGRSIVLLDRAELAKDQFELLPYQSTPLWISVDLQYLEEPTGQPAPGFEPCATGGDEVRIRESYTIALSITQNPVTVEGASLDPSTAVADYSIPYQDLPEDDTARWTVPLGRVQWQPSADPTVAGTFQAVDALGRVYGGVVAASLLAPDQQLVIRQRSDAPAAMQPDALVAVQGSLAASGLVTAAAGLDVDGPLQVRLDSSSEVVFGVVDPANPTGPLDAVVAIDEAGDLTASGQVAIGVATPGSNRLAVGAPGASAGKQFTVSDSGQAQVGGSLSVKGTLEINGSLSIHDVTDGDDSVSLILSRSQRATGQDDLRVQIGDKPDGRGRLVVGPTSPVDGSFIEQFTVDSLGDVLTHGSLSVGGAVNIGATLTVSGTSNLIVAHTQEISMSNNAGGTYTPNTPFNWTASHPGVFAEVYTAFAVWNGFSLWGITDPNDWANKAFWQHAQNVESIPQHAFVRVTDAGHTDYTSGVGYVSESDVAQEGDNSVLFTVVVLGRGL